MPWTPDQPERHELDDDALATEARTDPAAFADLYERYHATIFNFVRYKVRDQQKAEDITSQVFLRALRGLPTYRSGPFRGWIFQIARNTIVDDHRRERPTVSEAALIERADPGPGPSELVEIREEREHVHHLIDQLSDTQQDIIRLRLRGYTGQEIAEALGMKIGAVKSAQFRAFQRIREMMHASPESSDHSRFRQPDR